MELSPQEAGVLVGSGITLSKDGDIFATGVTTSTTSGLTGSGSGANLTNLPAANMTGTAISGANLTNLDASDLTSGTILMHDSLQHCLR